MSAASPGWRQTAEQGSLLLTAAAAAVAAATAEGRWLLAPQHLVPAQQQQQHLNSHRHCHLGLKEQLVKKQLVKKQQQE